MAAPNKLRRLPSVDRLLNNPATAGLLREFPRTLVVAELRSMLEEIRTAGTAVGDLSPENLLAITRRRLDQLRVGSPRSVVNATGVVLHTNLGRAALAETARTAVSRVASDACELEFDLARGSRGSRDEAVVRSLTALTGAESATVVNNNAAAVLLALNSMAEGREVIVSRGELVEIGGSFRIPDVCAKSGARLREVGTTNRTHLRDYENAIGPETGLLLKVHPSNYAIDGFTADVPLAELVALGRAHDIPVVEDLGSGALVDLSQYGLPREPVVAERVDTGADAITFSGDKLLGGPQAGLIVGRAGAIERMRTNPLKRALRCDKMTLAALDATLRLYRTSLELERELPTLRYLTRPIEEIEGVANAAAKGIAAALGAAFSVRVETTESQIGSGAQPTATIESRAVVIAGDASSPLEIAARFRACDPPIVGRVHEDRFWLDCRCIDEPDSLVPAE